MNALMNAFEARSELQRLISHSVESLFAEQVTPALLARFDAGEPAKALWQLVSELGLPNALAPEALGGSDASWLEVSPILRALGYWQVPLPLAESLLASALLAHAGLQVPEGPLTVIQVGRQNDLRLTAKGELHGRAFNVPWGRECRWAVVAVGKRLALVDLKQAAVVVAPASNFASEPMDTLSFSDAPSQALGELRLDGIDEPVWTLGAMLRACVLVGALEAVLDKTVAYANERVQFGKPIGKQQVLQQYLAQLAGATGAARMACHVALGSATDAFAHQPHRLVFDTAVAKVCAGEAASLACSVAHQVFGAIGFTHEHSLHFATRRLWSWRDEFGSDTQWAQVLGESAIAAGSAGFWKGLTDPSL